MQTDHERFRKWAQASLDGELNAADTQVLAEHLETCAGCRGYLAQMQTLKSALGQPGLQIRAPAGLAARIRGDLAIAKRPWFVVPVWLKPIALPLAGTALAALAGVFFVIYASGPNVPSELVRDHAAGPPVEIATADPATLRPWFIQKVAYAPPLLDGAEVGCALTGGRVAEIAGHKTAALAYRCDGHLATVYVEPSQKGRMLPRAGVTNGYQVVSWRGPKLACQAVSDMKRPDLLRLASYIQARAGTA